jgi:two-component system response regulator HydG
MPDESITEKFDLKSKVFFNHEAGKIWLDESRMLLLHAQAYGAQRKEIIELLG